MNKKEEDEQILLFVDNKVRRAIYKKELYFSVVDVVKILMKNKKRQSAKKYWEKLVRRLKKEEGELVTNCHQLKFIRFDGKIIETDCVNAETLFRIIELIPSRKTELCRRWLVKISS